MRSLLQLTLDLFGPSPELPGAVKPARLPNAPRATPKGTVTRGRKPPGFVDPPRVLPEVSPRTVAQALPEPGPSSGLVRFSHPRANRQLQLGSALVGYEFKRGKRRTIGFVVGADGLVVSAPKWVPLGEVDAAVREKAGWIVKKLGEARERHARMESTRVVWQDGAELPFLGETVVISLDPSHGFAGVGAELQAEPLPGADGVSRRTLRIGLARNASPEQIRDVVQAWLMRQAKRIFTDRMHHFAPLLGVQWRKLSLSSAGTRWGSASVDGSVRLNWRLIHFRLPIIDYVVAHELSHLRVMDHSPRFWDTVKTVVPDYAVLRGQLKQVPIPQWE